MNEEGIRFTVAISTYNVEKYVERAVKSVVNQEFDNFEIIIADEPTGALDSKTSEEIIDIFKELNKEGITIILITHDINVANKANRIVKIFDGELKEAEKNAI